MFSVYTHFIVLFQPFIPNSFNRLTTPVTILALYSIAVHETQIHACVVYRNTTDQKYLKTNCLKHCMLTIKGDLIRLNHAALLQRQ